MSIIFWNDSALREVNPIFSMNSPRTYYLVTSGKLLVGSLGKIEKIYIYRREEHGGQPVH